MNAADKVIRVAIVDDHPIARYGMEHVFERTPGVQLTMSADSLAELTSAIHTTGKGLPDIVIMDLYLDGDKPSLTALREVSAVVPVLVMSASARPADILGAIRAGASGYVTKQSDAPALVAAVRTVAEGGFWLSSRLADILRSELHAPTPRADAVSLSPREDAVLTHIASGLTHAQIAARMGISKATVDTYVERIRTKMQAGNKAQLTRLALERRPRL